MTPAQTGSTHAPPSAGPSHSDPGGERAATLPELIAPFRVIPVCGLDHPSEVRPLRDALVDGGLPVVELTLRAPEAMACLEAMATQPGILVGAGTVRTAAQLRVAVAAGAAFVVSPCFTEELAEAALDLQVPYLPGVATAGEIQRAVDAGFDTLKLFPAEAIGGLPVLRALADPFHDVRFVPTGGIGPVTAASYLSHASVLAVGGGWMVPSEARARGDWAAVRSAVAEAAKLR
ncbi:MAG TPA: bifunctional 4-hydroxy-2-oxoglutarate aldolase/2-dehydro-3-deoxy-phosphogluconate aldolase [Nocardioidaceae bacterium]|nr:bifunctional 4-hydroxy-2-oxoglutarate aldolase/2-dehydro-3-deoxy-phosphogluconate aldolase [Nocardioidaceae bacterium]